MELKKLLLTYGSLTGTVAVFCARKRDISIGGIKR
jgi:hypothetical protein